MPDAFSTALMEFIAEMDDAQDECYRNFLTRLGLDHTESTWDAFIDVWIAGYGWGESKEYSYPS
jgi:hypothetical protein